ncbi:MAG TPA: VanZ family protein [Acidobacteriota bacterium]
MSAASWFGGGRGGHALRLLAAWLALILLLTLLPDPGPAREINLSPLLSVRRLILASHNSGVLGRAARVWIYNIAGNLLLFLPVGLLSFVSLRGLRVGRSAAAAGAALFSLALSLAIELYHFSIPQRTADIDDVIFNLLGAAGGVALALWRDVSPSPSGPTGPASRGPG